MTTPAFRAILAIDNRGDGNSVAVIKQPNYNPAGTWSFNIQGQTVAIIITGNTFTFGAPGTPFYDTGTFTRMGNVGMLFSNALEGSYIGVAMQTSDTTMNIILVSPSDITGTFNGVKQ